MLETADVESTTYMKLSGSSSSNESDSEDTETDETYRARQLKGYTIRTGSKMEHNKVYASPVCDDDDDLVAGTDFDYSDRAEGDWVLSGPLGPNGHGPGTSCDDMVAAEAHARKLHGDRVKRPITDAVPHGRWAFLIKKAV